jgi:hypothetical protein
MATAIAATPASRSPTAARRASAAQPRLVTDGNIKGGRYFSDVVDIYAGAGLAH